MPAYAENTKSPLIMVLEDLGVRKEAFIDLQNRAVASARTIHDSIEKFKEVLSTQKMGHSFGLVSTLDQLRSDYDMDLKSIDNPFFQELRRVAMNAILRDIKHSARIPIENNYLLVGVADEGPAYERRGVQDVYCLNEGEIFGKVLDCRLRHLSTYLYQFAFRRNQILSRFGCRVMLPFPEVQ